ncbi:MAG TPA: MerR family DNA-binding transcriptional regulator, partial [Gemmatimonadaceae bacterium]|nr:MerR family DNA-binding transcriptional regulator [Gemmatimonadaceae bacterium]
MPTKIASTKATDALPVVRPDRLGYVLGGDWVDGFADSSALPLPIRRQIARLAERYAPGELSDAQRALLAARPVERASDLLRALAEDEADLDEAFVEGLYDSLDEAELAVARSQSYPLAIGKVSELTGASPRQIRYWEEQGLLRAYAFGGQSRYLRGGVLRAMALVTQEQHVLAT